ncbi:hypothetical protein GCM10023093_03840 [Nemorincola caseinilytica]|uniref:Lipoprotein n=1 Tax=Nemorincola caseinilytica TaxID=2054315 RepID=A0ABP8N6J4_9BACT
MKPRHLLSIAIPVLLAATGCQHEPFRPIGGKGGNATLMIYPQHHGNAVNLDSMMVFIKYDALDAPANGRYDDSATCTRTGSIVSCSFSGLWNGNYYLYARGYDHNVSQAVQGGIKYTVVVQQTINLMLPVSERH